ncbi:MAG TPA: hypothetical protein VMR41_00555 [Patescibacteria group bacterium]|nr:hypothetical protein [Patescibacteria group bacterium]
MTKYKQQVQDMLIAHQDIFNRFKLIHDKYMQDPEKWQKQFNEEGQEILHIVKRWENNLCLKSESGKYGKFSNSLADKFWKEIKIVFPKIDYIGLQ